MSKTYTTKLQYNEYTVIIKCMQIPIDFWMGGGKKKKKKILQN